MALYMVPLMRSGAMWSCKKAAGNGPWRRFWPLMLRWWGISRRNQSGPAPIGRRSFKPERPWC